MLTLINVDFANPSGCAGTLRPLPSSLKFSDRIDVVTHRNQECSSTNIVCHFMKLMEGFSAAVSPPLIGCMQEDIAVNQ